MKTPYFPLFVEIQDKPVTVIGGGKIAARRVRTLLAFGAKIRIISPQICDELRDVIGNIENGDENHRIAVLKRKYQDGDIHDSMLVIAATDDRDVNRLVKKACAKEKVPVNVIDDRRLCDFYFPSVVKTENVVIGINSGGTDPGYVKEVRKSIEKLLNAESGYQK